MNIFPLPIMITGKFITRKEYHDLCLYRLKNTKENTFEGYVKNYNKLRRLQRYCCYHKLKFQINNEFGKRSSNYRSEFFSHYKPIKKGRYYCSYCGKLIPKGKVTVDHLYPVHIVNKSSYYQAKLMQIGAKSVNDYRNLVPACKKCNRKKSYKIRGWVLLGKIGRHQNLWPIRKFIRFIVFTIFISFIIFICFKYFRGYII